MNGYYRLSVIRLMTTHMNIETFIFIYEKKSLTKDTL